MLVASPFSRGGHVCSQVFDHTSVIRFMEALTGVIEPNISGWRRRVCGDLMSAFDFTATSVAMSAPPTERRDGLQEAGTRPARALPYQPNANAMLADDRLRLTLGNDGAASVHMTVHAHDAAAPRRFDLAQFERAHESIATDGSYDVAVHGPNGFLRHFAGSAASPLDVHCDYDFASRARLRLTLANHGGDECIVTIKPNAYDNDADRIVPLAARRVSRAGVGRRDGERRLVRLHRDRRRFPLALCRPRRTRARQRQRLTSRCSTASRLVVGSRSASQPIKQRAPHVEQIGMIRIRRMQAGTHDAR